MEIFKAIVLIAALFMSMITLEDVVLKAKFNEDSEFTPLIITCILWGLFYYL